MKLRSQNDDFCLRLNKSEALVLFDWIAELTQSKRDTAFFHTAEYKLLCTIENCLEKELAEPILEEYGSLLFSAKQDVLNSDPSN